MKRLLLISLVALCWASTAFAVAGSIGVFADRNGASCAILNNGTSGDDVWIVHTGSSGTTGSAWIATIPSCAGFVHLVDLPQFTVAIGNSQIGVSVGYGDCLVTGSIAVTQLFVTRVTSAVGCCLFTVGPHPDLIDPGTGVAYTTPIENDCGSETGPVLDVPAAAGTGIVSANTALCPCNVDTHESTWGGVKELFRQGI